MKEFHEMREEFHPHETHVVRLASLLGNYTIKLYIETDFTNIFIVAVNITNRSYK